MKKNYLKNSIKKKKIIYEYYLYHYVKKNIFIIINKEKKYSYYFDIKSYSFKFFKYDMDGKYDRKSSYFPIIFNKNIKNAINSDDMTIRKLAVETICNKYLNKIKQLKSDKNLLNNFNYFKYV